MFEGRTRGRVAILRFGDGDGIVIKPVQSAREDVIARLAGEGFIGPSQFPSLEGFLSEEWVAGRFFTVLTEEAVCEEAMYAIGERLGSMLAELHARQIYYNDATVSDPDGRSHLIIEDKANFGGGAVPNCRLIDFGVSVLLDNFLDLEPEEVYNLVRTTPEFRLLSRMGLSGPEVPELPCPISAEVGIGFQRGNPGQGPSVYGRRIAASGTDSRTKHSCSLSGRIPLGLRLT